MSREEKSSRVNFKYFESKASEIDLSEEVEAERKEVLSTPVNQLDLSRATSIRALVDAWSRTSIQSRSVSECAHVYENMISDEDRPTIFLGLSGALIAGGLRKVIRDLVEAGFVDVIVSTGAIVYQDVYQAQGYKHYMGTPKADDAVLHDLYIDRIYDAYVDEVGFVKTDDVIAQIAASLPPRKYSTREFMREIGTLADFRPRFNCRNCCKKGSADFRPGDCRFFYRDRTCGTLPRGEKGRRETDATRHDPGQL